MEAVEGFVHTLSGTAAQRRFRENDNDMVRVLAATAIVAVPAALYYYVSKKRKNNNDEKKKLPYPPGPKENPIFGSLFNMPDFANGETFDTQNLANAKEYGLVYSVTLPFVMGRLIVVGDPQLAKLIMVTKNYPKSVFYKMLTPLVGPTSLVMAKGKEWADLRKAFNPGFTPAFLRGMVDTMATKLERFVDGIESDIRNDVPTNMLKRSQSFTSDVIVAIAFGEDWNNNGSYDKPHPARVLEDEICRLYSKIAMNPFRRLFDFPTKRAMKKVGIELEQEMRAILDRRLEEGKASTSTKAAANATTTSTGATSNGGGGGTESSSSAKDIATLAIAHLRSKNEDGELTEDDKSMIVDQFKTFYFAGHDTTATTIAWAMWELSRHPEALTTLRAELSEKNIWTSNDGDDDKKAVPTYEQLQQCVYLEGVIKEALRLYPPASGLSRQTGDAAASYKGYSLSNSILIVNAYVMGRHPDLWKDPEQFKPERFYDGSEDDINSKFMAFSRGPRDCIGKYFAILEAKLAVSALAMKYDLECVNPNDRIFTFLTNVPEDGAKVKFRPRTVAKV